MYKVGDNVKLKDNYPVLAERDVVQALVSNINLKPGALGVIVSKDNDSEGFWFVSFPLTEYTEIHTKIHEYLFEQQSVGKSIDTALGHP